MFADARTADVPEVLEGSVCVVGAGAAGINLARKLAETVRDVILVESGGFEIEGQTQNLFVGRQLGLRYFNLASCRLRYFGGTTNHWSGYCRANDPIDYEGRPEIGLPAWPISHGDLEPYITQAGRSLGIESEHFDPREIMRRRGIQAIRIAEDDSEILMTKAFQFASNKRLGPHYREGLEKSPNLKGILNLNLTHIQLDETATRVEYLTCKTLNGKTVRIKASAYALCCHGIENSRLLLISNDVMKNGVGNAHDHVGRYFMDHTHIHASKFIPTRAFPRVYDRNFARHRQMNVNLSFTDSFTRKAKLLQYYCRFNPIYASKEAERAAKSLVAQGMDRGSVQYLTDVAYVAGHLKDLTSYGLSRRGLLDVKPTIYSLEHRLEQAPNSNSRVVLSDRRDALGTLIADLDWRLNDEDIRSLKDGQDTVVRELAALGWGRVEEEEITRELVEDRVAGHYHQIGTTRMSKDPREGVVDANCRVHGIDNLYVGGSSVFPTAGYSGPTMMIVALALRLADHLKRLAA